jgi:hypothetical protein
MLPFFALAIALGAEDWKDKPVSGWTQSDLNEILNGSAWAYQSSAAFPNIAARKIRKSRANPQLSLGDVHRSSVRYPIIRILTAGPIRNALLMRTVHNTIEAVISVDDLAKEGDPDSEPGRRRRLRLFEKANPNDIRIKGDPDHIVIAITMRQVNQTANGIVIKEDAYPVYELQEADPSELMAQTVLSTKTGKRIPLSRYERPQEDKLGAKLYFPRLLPDGRPSVAPEDKELQLVFPIQGRNIKANFILDEMIYRNKLEL